MECDGCELRLENRYIDSAKQAHVVFVREKKKIWATISGIIPIFTLLMERV